MPKKYWKVIVNAVFLFAVFAGTYYFIFRDQELSEVLYYIHEANNGYLILGVVLALLFVCSESVIIQRLLNTVKINIPLLRCIKYSFVGYFFSAVTPSATGGQPMQVIWMKRDKISVADSTLVLMIVTAAYKTVLIGLSAISVIFEGKFITEHAGNIWYLVVFGVICNIAFIIFLVFAVFRQSWITRIIGKSVFWLGKHHIIKDRTRWLKKAWKVLSRYDTSADFLKQNKKVLRSVIWITIFQRLCLFAVTYVVYRSFGLHDVSACQIIALQTVIALAVDSLPLPGGIGASESSFLVIFLTIFGEDYILPGMLLSRGITYYAMIFISGAITLITHYKKTRPVIDQSGQA